MIKKSFRFMLLAALALSSVMFVACNKYDEDINDLYSKYDSLSATVQSLQSAISSGSVVTSVNNGTDGVTFTMSNGQSYTIKHGSNGKDGANGVDGKTPVITIDETTNNWVIDGVDTGVCANGKEGKEGKTPYINEETGNWMVWNAETGEFVDSKKSAIGAQTYVVEYPSYYELNVMNAETKEFTVVVLPKTDIITDIKAVPFIEADGKICEFGAVETVYPLPEWYPNYSVDIVKEVQFSYGAKIASNSTFKFNKVPYAGKTLVSANAKLSAIVNPMNADASMYQFSLVDSKGNAPYVLGTATQNKTEGALTKAATPNKGVWDMTVSLAENFSEKNSADREAALYALTTQTANGTVTSGYNVLVNEMKVSYVGSFNLNDLSKPVNKSIDLSLAFVNPDEKTMVLVDGQDFYLTDMRPFIVDHYFTFADQTVAEYYGLELNGDILTAKKPTEANRPIVIKAHYLLVDGTWIEGTKSSSDKLDQNFNVSFSYVAPAGALADVNWTINSTASKQVVYLPLGDMQSQLVGLTDTQLPSVVKVGNWYRANGKGLDHVTNAVEVNGVDYGYYAESDDEKFAGHENTWIATIDQSTLYYKNSSGSYVATTSSTTIQTALYVKFTFSYANAFPGEYFINLGLKKSGSSVNNFEVPVKVTITAPTSTITKYENYFVGNNAVAYGEADGTNATFDLSKLFKTSGLYFVETPVYKSNGTKYTPWLQADAKTVLVPAYKYGSSVDNTVTVNSSHDYKAVLVPFNNKHVESVAYDFTLTVKSAIAEGTFTTTAAKSIDTKEGVKFSVSEFNGVDVYGDKFYIGNIYKYDAENEVYTSEVAKAQDSRIKEVTVIAADDNAKDYLSFTQFTEKGTAEADAFSVTRRADLQQLMVDTPCTLTVRVTDKWGVRSEANVTVVLKAFGN